MSGRRELGFGVTVPLDLLAEVLATAERDSISVENELGASLLEAECFTLDRERIRVLRMIAGIQGSGEAL